MNETILIVDDSPDVVLFLRQYILAPLGYKVITASDGRSGLEMAVSKAPDLILLDMNMPRMTGLEMLVALRRTECEAPVIFMTVHGSESIVIDVFRLGVRDYLIKPFTVDEVEQAVNRALQEVRLAREKEALARNLAAAEAVRQTVITLSHYINNNLMVLNGGLALVREELGEQLKQQQVLDHVTKDCQASLNKIGAVIKVLQKVSNVQNTTYHGQTRMIDIEDEMRKELSIEGQKSTL